MNTIPIPFFSHASETTLSIRYFYILQPKTTLAIQT